MNDIPSLPSRYRIENRVGAGAFGTVYKVFDARLNQTVALKVLLDEAPNSRETLTREFVILSRLQHPNLVKVIDYGVLPSRTPFFTMEVIEGLDLRLFMHEDANVVHITSIIRQALSALQYLHGKGILHGDIKPENMMIVRKEDSSVALKVLDFGLTSQWGHKRESVSGTPRFLAPEILVHGAPYSPATDLYALGISLIESLTGVTVPSSNTVTEVFLSDVHFKLRDRLRKGGIRNPSYLASFIVDLCRPDLSDRTQTAKSALQGLRMLTSEPQAPEDIQLDSVFVDRTEEIKAIRAFLEPRNLDKRILILYGPTGIGKKTILRKAIQIAELGQYLLIGLPESPSSHFSIEQFVETLYSCLNEDQKKRFDSRAAILLPAPRHTIAQDRVEHGMSPTSLIHDRIIGAMHELSLEQPLLLVAGEIDQYKEDLLRFIVLLADQIEFRGSRIKILMTSRIDSSTPDKLSGAYGRIACSDQTSVREIKPFSESNLRQFLKISFGGELFDGKERRDLLRRTQGIPLIIAAFVRHLISFDVIQFENGMWTLDRRLYKQSRIPTDLGHSLAVALTDISRRERALLSLLAVYETSIARQELSRLAYPLVGNPDLVLDGLITKGYLRETNKGIDFAHILYAQFLLKQLSGKMVQNLNRIVADYLVSLGAKDSFRVARHYAAARDLDKANEYAMLSEKKLSSSNYMLFERLQLLLDLKKLASKHHDRQRLLEVLSILAPVEFHAGLPKQALANYYRLLDGTTDCTQKVHFLGQMAMIYREILSNIKESREVLIKALHYARKSGDKGAVAGVYYELAKTNDEEALAYLRKAVRLSAHVDINLHLRSLANLAYRYKLAGLSKKAIRIQTDVAQRADEAEMETRKEIYFLLSLMHFYNGTYAQARHYVEKKIRIEREQDDTPNLIYSIITLGGICYTEGRYYEMIRSLNEAYGLARRFDDFARAVTILLNLSLAYRHLSEYRQSSEMIKQVDQLMKREHIDKMNSHELTQRTQLFLAFGKAAKNEFMKNARRLRLTASKRRNRMGLGHYNIIYSHYHFDNFEMSSALTYAGKALTLFRQAEDRDDVVMALVQLASIQIVQGKTDDAAKNLKEATAIYEEIHCEYLGAMLMLAKVMLARATGAEDAKALLTDALRTSKKMGTRETTWQVQREFALYYKDQGELSKALSYYGDAVETIKQITESIDEEELKLSYLDVPFRKRVFTEIKDLKREIQKKH